jgi:hypothetical protein
MAAHGKNKQWTDERSSIHSDLKLLADRRRDARVSTLRESPYATGVVPNHGLAFVAAEGLGEF